MDQQTAARLRLNVLSGKGEVVNWKKLKADLCSDPVNS